MTHIGTVEKYQYKDQLDLSLEQQYQRHVGTIFVLRLYSQLTASDLYQESFNFIKDGRAEFNRLKDEDILEKYFQEELKSVGERI